MPPLEPYDAVLLVSFGGPEKTEDVVPFLENVTAGKNIPRERLEEVGEHYFSFGGKSPINDQCRELIAALESGLAERDIDLPVYWGNRNWHPFLADTAEKLAADGVKRVLAITTSAYSSYSSCRQYRENIYDVFHDTDIDVDIVRTYFHHPGFAGTMLAKLREAAAQHGSDAHVAFVTHSIPTSMNAASGGPGEHAYERQHRDLAAWLMAQLDGDGSGRPWSLAYCSRSGPPNMPWLEPDINDHMEELAEQGVKELLIVPIGFISDHMEVIFDLDTEAAATAQRLGMAMTRVPTAGVDPRFVDGLIDLALERAGIARGESVEQPTVGDLAPGGPPTCGVNCCINPRASRPAWGDVPVS